MKSFTPLVLPHSSYQVVNVWSCPDPDTIRDILLLKVSDVDDSAPIISELRSERMESRRRR